MVSDPEPREGILRLVPDTADWHARRVHVARLLPVLCFLGSDAGADVPADRHLGRPAKALRGNQVLPVHAVWLGVDAPGHSVPILPSPHCDRYIHFQHS